MPEEPIPDDALRVPRSLPRGRNALPRRVVLLSQRERLLEGMVRAVGEKGYAGTRVSDVTRNAGVSRTTFYEVFKDKEACFLAAYLDRSAKHIEYMAAASLERDHWLDQFRTGIRAYLRFLTESPDWSRMFLTAVLAAGPRAMDLRRDVHRRYAEILRLVHDRAREERPDLPAPPDAVYEASVAAANEIMVRWIEQGKATGLDELEATLLYTHLSLLGLAAEAAELFPPPE